MSVKIISFTQFCLYCKHVLRKHFPEGYTHLKTRVEKQQVDGKNRSILIIATGDREMTLPGTLEYWYEKYQQSSALREITDDMVGQCVHLASLK